MKNTSLRRAAILSAVAAASLSIQTARADLWWQPAGGVGTGQWDTAATANWNDQSDGSGSQTTWSGVGSGTAIFSAGNSLTGGFVVTVSGTQTAEAVSVEEGSILFSTGVVSLNSGTVSVATGATAAFGSNVLSGTNGIVKTGAGTLNLGTTQAFSKASGAILTINGGVVEFDRTTSTTAVALGTSPASATATAITLNGGTLRYVGTAALTLEVNRGMTIGANGGTVDVVSAASTGLSLPGAAAFTLNGAASAVFNKIGAGRFTLNTTSDSYLGKYKIFNGSISSAGDGRFGKIPTSAVADYFVLDGGALRDSLTSGVTWNANRGITLGAAGGTLEQPGAGTTTDSLTYNGIIAGTLGGGLTIAPTDAAGGGTTDGIVILGGLNTYDGPTTINTGMTLRIGANGGVIPDTSVVTVGGAGTTLDLATNGFDETIKGLAGTAGTVAVGAASLTIGNPSGQSYTSVITGTGKVIKNGTGTQVFGGNSAGFTGEFVINNGVVGIGNAGALGAGSVTINGGKLSNTATTGRTMTVPLNIAGSFAVDQTVFGATSGQISFNTGAITLKVSNPTITVDSTGYILPFGAVIGDESAGRGFTKDGAGILSLTNAANTYSGATTILNGQINLNSTSTLGNGAGTLNLSGGNLTTTAGRGVTAAPIPNPINVTANSAITTTSTAASVDLNLSSNLVGGSGGTLTFRNDAASGTGVFQPRFSGSGFNFARNIVIANGANGTTVLQAFNTIGTTETFSGDISGTGSYRRTSSASGNGGATVFTGNNTYSGGTTVHDGILFANSTTGSSTGSGAVTVDANGTLAGNGNVAGTVALSGKVSPGNSVGQLHTGSETWNAAGSYDLEVADATGPAGTGYDSVAVDQGGGTPFVNITNTAGVGNTFTVFVKGTAVNFDNTQNYSWILADASDLQVAGIPVTDISQFDPNAFVVDTTNFTNALNGGSFAVGLDLTNKDVLLNFSANVPEPGSVGLLLAGGMATLLRRRRRAAKVVLAN